MHRGYITIQFVIFEPTQNWIRNADQSYRDGEFDTTVGEIPVGKPGGTEWFRVHQDPSYCRVPVVILEDRKESGMVDNYYYVPPPLVRPLSMDMKVARSLVDYRLLAMVNNLGNLKVWLIKAPDKDGKQSSWARSELNVANDAKTCWVRRISNGQTGYNTGWPSINSKLREQEPDWHNMTMDEILGIAFRDFTIVTLDHIVLKKLRGEI